MENPLKFEVIERKSFNRRKTDSNWVSFDAASCVVGDLIMHETFGTEIMRFAVDVRCVCLWQKAEKTFIKHLKSSRDGRKLKTFSGSTSS